MRLVSQEEIVTGIMALNTAIESDVDINKPLKSVVNTAVIATPIQQGDKSWTTYKGAQGAFKSQFMSEIDSAVLVALQGATTGKEVADAIYSQIHYTGRKASKSVLDRSRRNANSLAAPLTNHTANVTRVQFGEANKKLIKGYVFVAVIDSQTSTQCRAGDGTTMKADDPRFAGFRTPPTGNANYGWILNMVAKLSDNGIAGFILANGALSGGGEEYKIRRKLIENKNNTQN